MKYFLILLLSGLLSSTVIAYDGELTIQDSFDINQNIVKPLDSNGYCAKAIVKENCVCVDGAFGSGKIICQNDSNNYEKIDFVPWPWNK